MSKYSCGRNYSHACRNETLLFSELFWSSRETVSCQSSFYHYTATKEKWTTISASKDRSVSIPLTAREIIGQLAVKGCASLESNRISCSEFSQRKSYLARKPRRGPRFDLPPALNIILPVNCFLIKTEVRTVLRGRGSRSRVKSCEKRKASRGIKGK